MVDLEILEKHGCTQARLREIFTAEKGTDRDVRENFQDLIQSRIIEGIRNSVKNSKLYMSVDIAWDSLPINKATIPLLQYAQGKITVDQCHDSLDDLKVAEQFCEYDDDGKLKTINTLRLYEVSVNLIRSYVTRRVAAQVHRFSNLYPYFKYESRSTSLEDKLRADVLSQRVEMMTDQFGYRHLWEQAIRQMFMYGHSVAFPETSWSGLTFYPASCTHRPRRYQQRTCRRRPATIWPWTASHYCRHHHRWFWGLWRTTPALQRYNDDLLYPPTHPVAF